MSEREEKIVETAKELLAQQFEKSSAETILACEQKSCQMADGFLAAIGKVLAEGAGEGKNAERTGGAGEDQYLIFSCLHSSIFLKNYLIQIELMGKEMYGEEILASGCWDAGELYRLFERDVEELKGQVRKRVPRIKEYETDYIRYAYAPFYHRMAKAFIREMLGAALEETENAAGTEHAEDISELRGGIRESGQVKILFGEYMGEADLLFQAERERLYEIFQDICG